MLSLKKAALLGVSASFALALAASPTGSDNFQIHFKSFAPAGTFGVGECPGVEGMVKLKYKVHTNMTQIQLKVSDLMPNTTYSVLIDGDGSGGAFPNAFTTNSKGKGSWDFDDLIGAPAENTSVTLFRWDGDFDTLWEVSDLELRAVGLRQAPGEAD